MNQSDNSDTAPGNWTTTQARNRASLRQWCDLAVGMQAVRGEWKASILVALSEEARDIPGLEARLEMANRRVLVRALRALEAERLIDRDAVSFHYALTADGAALVQILRDLAGWQGRRHRPAHAAPPDGFATAHIGGAG